MRAALHAIFPDRRRALSLALALAIEFALLVALLLWRPYEATRQGANSRLTGFSLSDDASKTPEKQAQPHRATPKQSASASSAAAAPPPPPIPKPAVIPPSSGGLKGVLPIELGVADIGKLGHHDTGADSGDTKAPYGPSEGPAGQPLYPVEWYREPTDAELGGYLPHGAPPGSWALIACQTIERYHVDNCRQLGESPVGSGLARAMRLAAWQFLVRPPRRGGQPIMHAWVKILISFGTKSDKSRTQSDAPADE